MTELDEQKKPIPIRVGDLLAAWEDDAEAAHDAYTTGQPRGPVTALPRLDNELGGFLSLGVHVIHGGPGSGKTALALQVAATCGCPAVYVTCEISPLELLRRTTARVTGTDIKRFKTGELSPAASLELARRAVVATPDLWILDASTCYPNRADIETVARMVRGSARHVLLVMDSVHSWAQGADTGGATEYESLNEHLTALNSIALALDAPVLAVAERNRGAMISGGQHASAGTRRFEYSACAVIELDMKTTGENLATREVPITLKLSKNRSGPAGKSVNLLFNNRTHAFREDDC